MTDYHVLHQQSSSFKLPLLELQLLSALFMTLVGVTSTLEIKARRWLGATTNNDKRMKYVCYKLPNSSLSF